jgi:hypothetical protein
VEEPSLTPAEALALLRENASRVAMLTDGLPAKRLHTAPAPGEWSPNDVLAHIRACCDVWGGNIARVLAEDHPTFPGMNPRTWMKRTDYLQWHFEDASRAFATQREALLATLHALTADAWQRTATVTSYGQSNERTLLSYASQLAKHERTHVRQIERTVG